MANGLIGAGKVRAADYSSGLTFWQRGFLDQGNTSRFELQFTEDKKELKNFQSAAGGLADSVIRFDKGSVALDAREFTGEIMRRALWGTKTANAGVTAIVDEAGYKATFGKFIPTKRPINTASAVTPKKGATALNVGDYVVSAGGITLVAAPVTAGLVDGDAITISYTPLPTNDIEALMTVGPEVSIHFEGINVNTGKYFMALIHRVKLGALQNLPLIGEDFGTFAVGGETLADASITDPAKSPYFELMIGS